MNPQKENAMREDEAKTKWCPLTRNIQLVAWGRSGDTYADLKSNCIASECMLWDWDCDENGIIKADKDGNPIWQGDCGLKR
jgi:hypothetical protein